MQFEQKSIEPIDITSPEGIERVESIFKQEEPNDFPLKPPDSNLQQSWLSGDLYTFLKTAQDTNGEYSVFDFVIPPQSGPPAHLHTREDEVFKVLQGELTLQQENRIDIAKPGDTLLRPKDRIHSFKNLGTEPVRLLLFATPSGIENFFADAGQPVTDPSLPPPEDDVARVLSAGQANGLIYYPETSIIGLDKLTPGTASLDGNNGDTIYGDDTNNTLTGGNGDDLYLGAKGNDTLSGKEGDDILVGEQGNDVLSGGEGNDVLSGREGIDTLTGGKGRDAFSLSFNGGIDIITDFGGVGTDENLSSGAVAEVDVLKFYGLGVNPRNMLLTPEGDDLVVSFEGVENTGARLQNFSLEDLENFETPTITGTSVKVGNILFDEQRGLSSLEENFDVFDANQQSETVLKENFVTFLNDLDNDITGFEDSDDVINGQGGKDYLSGLSGDDLLRGGYGNDTIAGGAGDDLLQGGYGNDVFVLKSGETADTILDFTDGQDLIQIAEELVFSDLKITQGTGDNASNVSIFKESGDELLAILNEVEATNLTSDDIVFA